MCMASGREDNSGEIARQNEAERARRVSEGTSRINQTFGKFDDSYYSGLGKSFLDYYKPDLDRLHNEAQKQLTFRFADAGSLDSAASNQKLADLGREYALQSNQLFDRSLSAQQEGRADVERNRADLIGQLEQGAGVESSAISALARANSLSAPPQYSPLGDMFSSITGALATSKALQGQGMVGLPITRSPELLGSKGSSSSMRTVGA